MQNILGQLSTSPPVGPIPTTPYAPANVAPIWQAPTPTATPPYTHAPPKQQFGFGSMMQPYMGAASGPMAGTAQGAPRNTDAVDTSFGSLSPAQQQARIQAGTAGAPSYGAQQIAKILQGQGINPTTVMPNYAARTAQAQPQAPAPKPAAPKPVASPQVKAPAQATLGVKPTAQQMTAMGIHPSIQAAILGQAAPRNV